MVKSIPERFLKKHLRFAGRKQTPETRLKRDAKKLLGQHGIFNFPLTAGLGSYPGQPDRVAHWRGKIIYLEFKAPGGRLGSKQEEFALQCIRDQVDYLVIRDLDQLIKFFELPYLL